MTVPDIIALASPILPVTLANLVLRGHWWRGFIVPLQFGAVPVQAILVLAARLPAAQAAAGAGMVIAITGLVAAVFREERFAHRAATVVFRWDEFESAFRSYLTDHPPESDGSLTST
jgi:drug/metabolite transporter (DMT)-like permease